MFVENLAESVMRNFSYVDKNGFGQLKGKIEAKLDLLGVKVNIYDATLTNVLHTGQFIGLNSFGHAKLL